MTDQSNAASDAFEKAKSFFAENSEKLGDSASDALAQAKDFFEQNKDKIEEALKSEKAEDISDNVLDNLAGFAKKVLGEDQAARIEEIRNNIDKSIGND